MAATRRDSLLALAIVLIGALCYLPALGQTKRWGSHEARHAEIAREMLVTGDYAVPHHAGEIYFDKPPLFHWLVALAYRGGGVSDFTMRLPSALAAIAGAVAVFLLGRRLYSSSAGFVAALLLLTTNLYGEWAITCRMDMVMTAALTGVALFTAYAAWAERLLPRLIFWELASLCLAAAALAKGGPPLGVGLGFMALIWCFLARRPRAVWPLAPLLLATLVVVVGAWVKATLGTGFLEGFFSFQSGETGPAHRSLPVYYLLRLPIIWIPHVLWLPSAAGWAVWRFRTTRRRDWIMPLVVLAIGLLAFSIPGNKREHYILPFVPFSCLTVGWFMVERARTDAGDPRERLLRWPLLAWFVVAAPIAGVVVFGTPGQLSARAAVVAAVVLTVVILSVIGFRRTRQTRLREAVAVVLVESAVLVGGVYPAAVTFLWKPTAEQVIAREIAAKVPAGVTVALGPEKEDSVAFRLKDVPVDVETPVAAAVFARLPRAMPAYAVMPVSYVEVMQASAPGPVQILGYWSCQGDEDIVLLRLMPATGGEPSQKETK